MRNGDGGMISKHINLFVGESNNKINRNSGASGGVGTEILEYLLNSRKVDMVVGVGYDGCDKVRPVYRIINNAAEIQKLSGSKYVFMELPPLIRLLEAHSDKKIAVVVQPCFVKFIRRKFKNVICVISFFCGYNIEYAATAYLLHKARIKEDDVSAIEYRGGEYPGGFTVFKKDGSVRSFGKECYELIDLLFLRKECSKCKYYISDSADIVLGDAWIKGVKNKTVVLINTQNGDDVIRSMHHEKLISLYGLDEEELLEMHSHNLKYKNYGHSPFMKFIVKIFNNKAARKLAPFYFFSFLSRIRRHFKIGIKKDLKKIEVYY